MCWLAIILGVSDELANSIVVVTVIPNPNCANCNILV